jgi:uncharacterized membrane protein YheB (UPF0754 family)
LVKQSFADQFTDDPIVSIGSYFDKQVQIEILAKRRSGKMLAAECKYSKDPAKIHMINALKEKCKKVELNVTNYALFSKNGFTSEVEELKDEDIKLLSHDHLSTLVDNLTKDDVLVYKNKKY